MRTILMLAVLVSPVLAQDPVEPPRRGPQEPPMDRNQDELFRRLDELRAQLESAEGEERERIMEEIRAVEEQMRRRPGPGRRGEPLTDELRAEVQAWLEEAAPEIAAELSELQSEGRDDEYEMRIRELAGWMREMTRMAEHNPEMYEEQLSTMRLEHRSMTLGRQYMDTDDEAERASTEEELHGVLSELFDLREAMREREIQELERRISELRDELALRQQNKDQIVEARLLELTGRRSAFEWDR